MKIKFTLAYFLLLFLFISFEACTPLEEEAEPTVEINATPEKTSAMPGEVMTIEFSEPIKQQNYSGLMGGSEVYLTGMDKQLSFIIPQLNPGNYTLSFTMDGKDYSFDLQVLEAVKVQNPEEYLSSLVAETEKIMEENENYFNALVAEGLIDESVAQQEINTWGQIYQNAMEEFAGMSPEQQQELANIIEANKNWMVLLDEVTIGGDFSLRGQGSKKECQELINTGKTEAAKGHFFCRFRNHHKYLLVHCYP